MPPIDRYRVRFSRGKGNSACGAAIEGTTMLTASLLKQVFPLCADPAGWTQALNPALERYEINTRAPVQLFGPNRS